MQIVPVTITLRSVQLCADSPLSLFSGAKEEQLLALASQELLGAELDTEPVFALETLYKLMDEVLEKGPLHEHGVTADELPVFAKNVIETQQRLLGNNYVELSEDDLLDIYRKAF